MIREDQAVGAAEKRWRFLLGELRAHLAVYLLLVAGYVLLRLVSFTGGPLVVTDTESYRRAAAVPLWDPDFYAGLRGWTVPLFYKLVPGDWSRVVAQLVLSVVAWIVLAAVTASFIRRPTLQPVAFAIVLLFSLSFAIVAWDSIMLSESLSLSLLAVAIASWLVLVDRPAWATLAIAIVALLFWVGTRDTHAYAALFAVPFAVVWPIRADRAGRPVAIAAVVGLSLVGVAGVASANAGGRWMAPLDDSIGYHVLPDPAARSWFLARGMPDGHGQGSAAYRRWLEADGREVYVDFLLSRPIQTLMEPAASLERLDELLAPDLRRYPVDVRETLPRVVADLLFPPSTLELVFWLVVVSLTALGVARRFGASAAWSVPATAVLLTVPHTVLVWHASGQEFGRHSLPGVVGIRLGLLLLALYVLDAVLTSRVHRGSPPTVRAVSPGRRRHSPRSPA